MYVGQTVYLRDQYGNFSDPISGIRYIPENTTVTDLGPHLLYLSSPVNITAGDSLNDSYFTLFTAGNAYYTTLSSINATNPTLKSNGETIAAHSTILPTGQSSYELSSLTQLKTLLDSIITNTTITASQTIEQQVKLTAYSNGSGATTKLNQLVEIIRTIIQSGESSAPAIIKTGTVTSAYTDAATLILANIKFLVEEITSYISTTFTTYTYNSDKCRRDVELICRNIAYDLQQGGNYNSVYSGLSYYSRPGTYHIVTIEENTTNFNLFPDGALVNFYQRSYMSASGYLFEYVGAGTNYGALPQVGVADPVQANEVNMLNGGKVFFTSTDQNGDFRIGSGLVISQASGVLSGRTFQKSLYAEMTPFILAIEG